MNAESTFFTFIRKHLDCIDGHPTFLMKPLSSKNPYLTLFGPRHSKSAHWTSIGNRHVASPTLYMILEAVRKKDAHLMLFRNSSILFICIPEYIGSNSTLLMENNFFGRTARLHRSAPCIPQGSCYVGLKNKRHPYRNCHSLWYTPHTLWKHA